MWWGKITKNSKCITLIIVSILLVSSGLFAQATTSDDSLSQTQLDETQYVLSTAETDSVIESGDTSSPWLFIRMIIVLIVVIGCIYVAVRLMRRGMNPQTPADAFLKKAATLVLSPGKTVHVVTLQDHAYLVGTADNSITLLGEITDKELVDALNLQSEILPGKRAPDFASVLSLFMPKPSTHKPTKKNYSENTDFYEDNNIKFSLNGAALHSNQHTSSANFSDSVSDAAQNLQKQRERLKNSSASTEDIR